MGGEVDKVNQANTEKATYDRTLSTMKIGVCEMQGWRRTMEDAAIVLPNFEKNSSLFGILEGHGGSIISEFVSVNFKNVLIHLDSYKNGYYEQALSETFLVMDEILKNKKINNFIYTTHNSKEKIKASSKSPTELKGNENIIKLRFEAGIFEFDLNEIDLSIGGEDTSITLYEYKYNNNTTPKNNDVNKNIKIEDIFLEKGGKQYESLESTLPPFEDFFNKRRIDINFTNERNALDLIPSTSSNKLSLDNLVASEMGTTANIMLIKNGVIYIANAGDSLSVMYKNKKAYNLNREHQTIIESEKERVLKSGATIVVY